MAKSRLELHEKLCNILGSRNCYFSPPPGIQMEYPCIRYEYSNNMETFADNRLYLMKKRYTLTVIDYDPDSEIPDKLYSLLYCSSNRNYVADGLNHFVFELFW